MSEHRALIRYIQNELLVVDAIHPQFYSQGIMTTANDRMIDHFVASSDGTKLRRTK